MGDEENEARHWQEGSNSTWMIILASVYSTVAIIVDADLGYCIKEWAEMCFYIPAISPGQFESMLDCARRSPPSRRAVTIELANHALRALEEKEIWSGQGA